MMDLIRIRPDFSLSFSCPECHSAETVLSRIFLPGIYWLADYNCLRCDTNFFQSLPVGHMIDYPLSINAKSHKLYPEDWNRYWQFAPFLKACSTFLKKDVSVKKVVYDERKKVIILNALDYLYGHTLLKLYNALHHLDHDKDLGLVIIIPRIFEWMIPKGCAEAWIVNLRLEDLRNNYEAIDQFVENECKRFDEAYISPAYSHPDFTTIDISRLTGVHPFDIGEFYRKKPVFTFVLREDRWWMKSRLSNIGLRMSRKLNLGRFAGRILVKKQDALVRRTIRLIRQNVPEAEFFVAGVGRGGSLAGSSTDTRTVKIDPNMERHWCGIYAKSHVVIGVHGSNMLLPTAFAAGCVEVLMDDRIRNMVQDISVRYTDRLQLFFYRFVSQYASPNHVANHAIAIYRNYENCYRNMVLNVYR